MCDSVRLRIEVSVLCVYNRVCVLNSVKLKVKVSVICVYIIGNVWFIVDSTPCSWQMRLRLQVSVICNSEELMATSTLCTGTVYLMDQSDCDI